MSVYKNTSFVLPLQKKSTKGALLTIKSPAKEIESYLKVTTCLPVDTSKMPHFSVLLSLNANRPFNLSISPAS